MGRFLVASRLIFLQIHYLSLKKCPKPKNNYESWFTGHYPSPLQGGKSYRDKNGHATCCTNHMYENGVNYGLPPDKQLVFGQMFEYFTDCTLGQVPFFC